MPVRSGVNGLEYAASPSTTRLVPPSIAPNFRVPVCALPILRGKIPPSFTGADADSRQRMGRGVMVARRILVPLVGVQVPAPQFFSSPLSPSGEGASRPGRASPLRHGPCIVQSRCHLIAPSSFRGESERHRAVRGFASRCSRLPQCSRVSERTSEAVGSRTLGDRREPCPVHEGRRRFREQHPGPAREAVLAVMNRATHRGFLAADGRDSWAVSGAFRPRLVCPRRNAAWLSWGAFCRRPSACSWEPCAAAP